MRVKALKKFDQLLSWSTSEKLKAYVLSDPLEEETFAVDIPEIQTFAAKYGYFSEARPIIGNVTTSEVDVKFVCCLLKTLFKKGDDIEYLQFAAAEVLAKALAYRDLKKGQRIQVPVIHNDKVLFTVFTVDHQFNLWHGMPAFGLVPEHQEIEPILLFRGTDFSLDSERGWASLLSDLDMAGPGLTAFRNSQEEIHRWMVKASQNGKKTKVLGFSLGGAIAAYTFIYENAWVSSGSAAFCPPGVAEKVIEDWKLLPADKLEAFTTYVNEGDLISKVGKLFGTVYALSGKKRLKPLSAHTQLMCAETILLKARVDVKKENDHR